MEGNVITNPGEDGISAWNGSPAITGNTITGARVYGIGAQAGADVRIEANELSDNAIAVLLARGHARDNSLSGNGVGISLGAAAEASANEILDGVTGIVATSGTPTIADNTISGNEQGLVVSGGSRPVLSGNTICDNGTNLVVPDGAEPPDTAGNEVCADVKPAA